MIISIMENSMSKSLLQKIHYFNSFSYEIDSLYINYMKFESDSQYF